LGISKAKDVRMVVAMEFLPVGVGNILAVRTSGRTGFVCLHTDTFRHNY